MSEDTVKMPKALTAENGAKYIFMGEFEESIRLPCPECKGTEEEDSDCEICKGHGEYRQPVTISWTRIKEIYAKAVEHFGAEIDS